MMRYLKLNLFLFIFPILLSSCFTLYSRGPSAQVESPEVNSSDKVRSGLNLKAIGSNSANLINDVSARPPTVNSPPQLDSFRDDRFGNLASMVPSASYKMNLPIPFEVSFGIDPFGFMQSSFGFGIDFKYQFMGQTYDQNQFNSHLMAFTGHTFYSSQNLSGEQKGLFGPGGYPYSARSHYSSQDLGLSYGYRVNKGTLYYAGISYQIFAIDGDVNQSTASNGTAGGSYQFPLTLGKSTKVAAGVMAGKEVVKFSAQLGYMWAFWGVSALYVPTLDFGLQIQFDPAREKATEILPQVPISPNLEAPADNKTDGEKK